ncbi:hypothetical protein CSC74_11865 [Pseudoxanthomonas yeongjuensis]|nr:hypothetical protein CSC74_11865 [Pseudoxanthomonas yeongjuensis]
MMHLGRFWFKNDEVVLLSGSPREVEALASTLEETRKRGDSAFVVSDLALVSVKHPAHLIAVQTSTAAALAEGEFHWPSLGGTDHIGTINKLRDIAQRESEDSFPLLRTPASLLVACHSHYNDQWWSVYG